MENLEKITTQINESDLAGFSKSYKDYLACRLDALLQESLSPLPALNEEQSEASIVPHNQAECDALLVIRQTAKHLGGDDGFYEEGLFEVTLRSKQAALQFCDFLEECDSVDEYDLEITSKVEMEEVDFDEIDENEECDFDFFVYLVPEIVSYEPGYIEDGPGEEEVDVSNGYLSEVKRVIKINFRGKRRIKMQCSPGFRWDASSRSCKKISGSEVAVKRKALRKAVRTKKALGTGFKVRVKRKTRKALRFRKSMGLG